MLLTPPVLPTGGVSFAIDTTVAYTMVCHYPDTLEEV